MVRRRGTWASDCVALALVDAEFAKQQLILNDAREWYMHPSRQLPAYEWAFGDVNPPVHAWAAWRVYKIDKKRRGTGDRDFLARVFQKLILNFYVVGESQSEQRRAQHLSGRIPGGWTTSGSSDSAASLLPTGGFIRASRWHGLDEGDVLPESAGDRDGVGERRPRVRGRGVEILGALPVHIAHAIKPSSARTARACGTRRTATTTCCTSPTGCIRR